MEKTWLYSLRDLLWELIIANEKGDITLNAEWLQTVVATHASLDEWLETLNNSEDQ